MAGTAPTNSHFTRTLDAGRSIAAFGYVRRRFGRKAQGNNRGGTTVYITNTPPAEKIAFTAALDGTG